LDAFYRRPVSLTRSGGRWSAVRRRDLFGRGRDRHHEYEDDISDDQCAAREHGTENEAEAHQRHVDVRKCREAGADAGDLLAVAQAIEPPSRAMRIRLVAVAAVDERRAVDAADRGECKMELAL